MHFLPSSWISLLAYWLLRAILSFPSIGLLCDRQARPDWRHRWVETQGGKAERSDGNTAVIDISDHLAVPANFSENLVKWGKVKYRLRQWGMWAPRLINQLGETHSIQVEYYSAVWWQRWAYPNKSPKMLPITQNELCASAQLSDTSNTANTWPGVLMTPHTF